MCEGVAAGLLGSHDLAGLLIPEASVASTPGKFKPIRIPIGSRVSGLLRSRDAVRLGGGRTGNIDGALPFSSTRYWED